MPSAGWLSFSVIDDEESNRLDISFTEEEFYEAVMNEDKALGQNQHMFEGKDLSLPILSFSSWRLYLNKL